MSPVHRALALGTAAALLVGGGLVLGGQASADASYTGTAEAGGLRLILTNQSIPLNISPQAQGPLASATQNSLQQSDALAAFPWPGQDVAGLPGVTAGSTGLPLPGYPFVVSTSLGDVPAKLSYPGIELHAESAKTLTQATATGGSASIGSTSVARVLRDADTVDASAVTDADVFRLGDDLTISGLHAAATAARDASGVLTRSSVLSFSSLAARGLTFTVPPPPGSNQAGQKVSAPAISLVDGKFRIIAPGQPANETEVPAEQVEQALTQAGYPTTYEQAKQTSDGIVGAGLQVRATLPGPPPGTPGGFSGETPIMLALGLVKAEITYQAAAAPAAVGVGIALPGTPAAAPAIDAAAPAAPGIATAPIASAATAPVASAPAVVPVAAAPAAPTIDLAEVAVSRPAPPKSGDLSGLYWLVAVVGIGAFGCTVLLRFGGVQ